MTIIIIDIYHTFQHSCRYSLKTYQTTALLIIACLKISAAWWKKHTVSNRHYQANHKSWVDLVLVMIMKADPPSLTNKSRVESYTYWWLHNMIQYDAYTKLPTVGLGIPIVKTYTLLRGSMVKTKHTSRQSYSMKHVFWRLVLKRTYDTSGFVW